MKIHQAHIGLPSMEQFLGALVAQRALPPQPLLQVVPCTHIVSRKEIEAPAAAQENIFSRPAANAAQLLQSCASCCMVEICESLVFDLSSGSGGCNFADGKALGTAETEGLQGPRINTCQSLRCRKSRSSLLGWVRRFTESDDESAKQSKAGLQVICSKPRRSTELRLLKGTTAVACL